MLGFNTYTADKIKKYNGEALGEVALLQEPIEFGNTLTQKTAKLIDVIWFNEDDNPSHCFEVEHTTDIVNGLRRLIELKPYHTKFYTIASEEKRQKFNRVMLGIQFRSIKDRFNFISYEELADFYRTTKTFSETKNKVLRE